VPGRLVGDLFVVVQEAQMSRPKRIVQASRAALSSFLEIEASGGIVLLVATVAALVWANVSSSYESFWHIELSIGPLTNDLQHWTNDGLMTLFFFVVGLEIKRELVLGELRDFRVASLPMVAAVGGMAGPALIYLLLNGSGTEAARGWAIPMATDIAFVVGALSLFGSRVPSGLKLFVLTLAIVDDIGAIAVIALVYSEGVDAQGIFISAMAIVIVLALRGTKVAEPYAYAPAAVLLWYGAVLAGVHPTLAGVALGLLTPAEPVRDRSVLEDLEGRLHPFSSHVVVPIFALANAGVAITVGSMGAAFDSRVFWGIVGGLVVGKTVGIFGTSRAAVTLRLGRRPEDVGWGHLFGGAAISGIGFTVALFITGLAFTSAELTGQAKLGVLAGSAISAMLGASVLALRHRGLRA
jgi:NhaA family Na+:H+ antiporter